MFNLSESGRKYLFSLPEEKQQILAKGFAKYNTLERKYAPKQEEAENKPSLFSRIGSGMKAAATEHTEVVRGEQADTYKKSGGVGLFFRTLGQSAKGILKGSPEGLAQIGAGLKNFDATKRSLFDQKEVLVDPDNFLAEQRRKADMEGITNFFGKPTSEVEAAWRRVGQEGTVGAIEAIATEGMGTAGRIARFGAEAAASFGTEALRTGDLATAGVAGLAGGAFGAIPKAKLRTEVQSLLNVAEQNRMKPIPKEYRATFIEKYGQEAHDSLFHKNGVLKKGVTIDDVEAAIPKKESYISKKAKEAAKVLERSETIKKLKKSSGANSVADLLLPSRWKVFTKGERGEAISSMMNSKNYTSGKIDLSLRNTGQAKKILNATTEELDQMKKYMRGELDEVSAETKALADKWDEFMVNIRKSLEFDKRGIGNVEGHYIPITTNEAGYKKLYTDDIAESAKEFAAFNKLDYDDGVKFLENIRLEKDPVARMEMIQSMQSKPTKKGYEKSRTLTSATLPDAWVETDLKKVFNKYIVDASDSASTYKVYGKDANVLHKQVNELVMEGQMTQKQADSFLKSVLVKNSPGGGERALKSVSATLFLPKAAAIQLMEVATNALRVGASRQMKSVGKISLGIMVDALSKALKGTGMSSVGEFMAKQSDLLLKDAKMGLKSKYATQAMKSLTGGGTWNPFTRFVHFAQKSVDMMNVDASVDLMRSYAKQYANTRMPKSVSDRLKGFYGKKFYSDVFDETGKLRKGVSAEDVDTMMAAAHFTKSKPVGLGATPELWESSALGRTATQYKQFAFPVMETFWQAIKNGTTEQKATALMGFMVLGGAGGYIDDKWRGLWERVVAGKEPEKDDLDLLSKIMAYGIGSFSHAGAFGVIEDTINTAKYSRDPFAAVGRLVGGPMGSVLATLTMGGVQEAIKEVDDSDNESMRNYAKGVLKSAPLTKAIFSRTMERPTEKSAKKRFMKQVQKKENVFAKGFSEFMKNIGDEENFSNSPLVEPLENKKDDVSVNSGQNAPEKANAGQIALQDAKGDRKQCGEYVNDIAGLKGKDRMLDSGASKTDSPNFERGGTPEAGKIFVEDTGTKYDHTGFVTGVDENGMYVTDYNYNNDEKRQDTYIPFDSDRFKKIIGYQPTKLQSQA